MSELDLAGLPPLPQARTIAALAPRLWADGRVAAVWLGGSLAEGSGDEYSDIDLRAAVAPADFAAWAAPDLDTLLGGAPLGRQFIWLGEGALIHHLILQNGDILDLLVQATARSPVPERVVLLGCRDADFARALAGAGPAPEPHAPATPEAARELVVAFWVNSHKHRKVLHRGLDLMIPSGLYHSWMMLMRMWFALATGEEAGPHHFAGIHGLTALVRAVERVADAEALALFGAPARTRAEIYAAIERHQEAAARAGRALAERLGFAYPEALERTVRDQWAEFTRAHPV